MHYLKQPPFRLHPDIRSPPVIVDLQIRRIMIVACIIVVAGSREYKPYMWTAPRVAFAQRGNSGGKGEFPHRSFRIDAIFSRCIMRFPNQVQPIGGVIQQPASHHNIPFLIEHLRSIEISIHIGTGRTSLTLREDAIPIHADVS